MVNSDSMYTVIQILIYIHLQHGRNTTWITDVCIQKWCNSWTPLHEWKKYIYVYIEIHRIIGCRIQLSLQWRHPYLFRRIFKGCGFSLVFLSCPFTWVELCQNINSYGKVNVTILMTKEFPVMSMISKRMINHICRPSMIRSQVREGEALHFWFMFPTSNISRLINRRNDTNAFSSPFYSTDDLIF